MGFFDNMKLDKLGKAAYNVHVQANDLSRRGKPADARAKYSEALELYKTAYDAGCRKNGIMMSYSILLMRFGEFERARELMREISAIGGMNEEVHFELRINYSICLWRMGILDKAEETLRFAGKYAKNSSYYSILGSVLNELADQSGDFEAARQLHEEAMDYDEDDAAALDNYGEYYRLLSLRARDAEEKARLRKSSIDCFERALKAKPGQITSLYAMAKYCIEDGDKTRAAQLLDKAIMHSGSKVCPVSIEMLRELRSQL